MTENNLINKISSEIVHDSSIINYSHHRNKQTCKLYNLRAQFLLHFVLVRKSASCFTPYGSIFQIKLCHFMSTSLCRFAPRPLGIEKCSRTAKEIRSTRSTLMTQFLRIYKCRHPSADKNNRVLTGQWKVL